MSKSKLAQPRRSEESPFLSNNSHLDLSYPPPSPSQQFTTPSRSSGGRRGRLLLYSILSGLLILLVLAGFNSDDVRARIDPDGSKAAQVGQAWDHTAGSLHNWIYGSGAGAADGGEEMVPADEDGMEDFIAGTGDDVEGELSEGGGEDSRSSALAQEEQYDEIHGTNTAAAAAAAAEAQAQAEEEAAEKEKEKEAKEGVEDGDSSKAAAAEAAQAEAEAEAEQEDDSTPSSSSASTVEDDEFAGASEADLVDPYAIEEDAGADGDLLPIMQDFGTADADGETDSVVDEFKEDAEEGFESGVDGDKDVGVGAGEDEDIGKEMEGGVDETWEGDRE